MLWKSGELNLRLEKGSTELNWHWLICPSLGLPQLLSGGIFRLTGAPLCLKFYTCNSFIYKYTSKDTWSLQLYLIQKQINLAKPPGESLTAWGSGERATVFWEAFEGFSHSVKTPFES